jgi:hypothetical protein
MDDARSKLESIIADLQEALQDAGKFDRGNASAGTRLRKSCMTAQKGLQALRAQVLDTKRSRKQS